MEILCAVLLTLEVIINSIEISSGMPPKTRDFLEKFGTSNEFANRQELDSELEPSPDGHPNSASPHSRPLFAAESPSTGKTVHVRSDPSTSLQLPTERSHRSRTRSPPARHVFTEILGYNLEDLSLIRLASKRNPELIFELKKYVFPANKPIRLRTTNHNLEPMPTEEQIVLSTGNGDIFAIFTKSCRRTILRGIYQPASTPFKYSGGKRAKMNMHSGLIRELTTEEIAECPLNIRNPIIKNFRIYRV